MFLKEGGNAEKHASPQGQARQVGKNTPDKRQALVELGKCKNYYRSFLFLTFLKEDNYVQETISFNFFYFACDVRSDEAGFRGAFAQWVT